MTSLVKPRRKNPRQRKPNVSAQTNTTRQISQASQRDAFVESHSREHRVTDPDGRTTADITTFSTRREHETVEALILEDVRTFKQEKVVPAFYGTSCIKNSAFIRMLDNRFEMASYQSSLMYYDGSNDSVTGPGFYLCNSEEGNTKLNYSIFRGLNTFEKDFKMQSSYPEYVGNVLYSKYPSDEILKFMSVDKFVWNECQLLKKHHQNIFGKHQSDWETTIITPITVEELLTMTLCRYVARLRNMSMQQVDLEESTHRYPIVSIDIDPDSESGEKQGFGSVQQILNPFECPLNGIASSLTACDAKNENERIDVKMLENSSASSETEMEIIVCYDFTSVQCIDHHRKMFYLEKDLMKEYVSMKSMQRIGINVQRELHAFANKVKLEESKTLESYLFTPAPLRGIAKSSLLLDLDAIGAIKKYIAWCNAKFEKKSQVGLLQFRNDGQNVRDSIEQLEQGLQTARKKLFAQRRNDPDLLALKGIARQAPQFEPCLLD